MENSFQQLVNDAKTRITEISCEDLKYKLDNNEDFYLIDVREDNEWNAGAIAHALHMSRGTLEMKVEKHIPNKNSEIVLYCGGGMRSALAADILQKIGYSNVLSLQGGFREWTQHYEL